MCSQCGCLSRNSSSAHEIPDHHSRFTSCRCGYTYNVSSSAVANEIPLPTAMRR
jgi:hypothetical protein